jgi:hypothetical protein
MPIHFSVAGGSGQGPRHLPRKDGQEPLDPEWLISDPLATLTPRGRLEALIRHGSVREAGLPYIVMLSQPSVMGTTTRQFVVRGWLDVWIVTITRFCHSNRPRDAPHQCRQT